MVDPCGPALNVERRFESRCFYNHKMKTKNCEACGDEGVCWVLEPCPECDKGKKIKKIEKQITKDLKKNKIKVE